MDFLLTKHFFSNSEEKLKFFDKIGEYSLFIGSLNIICLQNNFDEKIILVGDIINPDILRINKFSLNLVKSIKGVFNILVYKDDQFLICSSLFGFLPVYYSYDYNVISNSLELIKEVEDLPTKISKQFILESYLFNFSFSNKTYLNGINRLEAFSGIRYSNGKVKRESYENIVNWFDASAIHGRNQLEKLAEIFLNQTKQYFSSEKNSVTFTSGFDGRTIVSAGLSYHKLLETFSWGIPDNDDVKIPRNNAKELGLVYRSYNLQESNYIESYLDLSQRMSKTTGGFNGFLYPHFLYGVLKEKKYSNTLLAGYCGSELFRALHIQGAITSKDLVRVFNEPDDITLKNLLWNSEKLSFIVKSEFISEFENLFEEILAFRNTESNFHTKNQFFYSYIFSEVFRKVFGAWASAQMEEINVRVPFLDYDFVIALLKTDFAGCNNDFFVHNPLKRLKGQMLYAEIIRQSSSEIYKMKTGKGYRPVDLLTLHGKSKILFPYLKKQFKKQAIKPYLDNLGLISSYSYHKKEIEQSFLKLDGFEYDRILNASQDLNPYTLESNRDLVLQTASFASLI